MSSRRACTERPARGMSDSRFDDELASLAVLRSRVLISSVDSRLRPATACELVGACSSDVHPSAAKRESHQVRSALTRVRGEICSPTPRQRHMDSQSNRMRPLPRWTGGVASMYPHMVSFAFLIIARGRWLCWLCRSRCGRTDGLMIARTRVVFGSTASSPAAFSHLSN